MRHDALNAKLIHATNVLCEYVSQHIAEDWELRLVMIRGAAHFELEDNEGNDVPEFGSGDSSSVIEACQASHEKQD